MVKGKKPTRAAYALSIKPAPDVRERLREAADAAGRTLTKEIELRLAASVQGDIPSTELYSSWSADDQLRFRSFANVMGLLCAQVFLTHGPGAPLPFVLFDLRYALDAFLDGIGAKPLDEPGAQKFFAMIARQMLEKMRQAAALDAPTGQDAAFADFVRAWGISVEGAS